MSTDTPTPAELPHPQRLRLLADSLDSYAENDLLPSDNIQGYLRQMADEIENKAEFATNWPLAKDAIAQEDGYKDWEDFKRLNISQVYFARSWSMFERAAALFAENAFHRGAREQREICNQPNAPAPEFKA